MELRQYLLLVKRWFWIILLGIVVAGTTAFIVSKFQRPVYEATATLLITEGNVTSTNDFADIQASERLAESYIERLTNHEVLSEAAANLGLVVDLEELEKDIRVVRLNKSQLIAISVESTNPELAAALANEIPAVFASRDLERQLARFTDIKTNLDTELDDLSVEIADTETTLASARESGAEAAEIAQLTADLARSKQRQEQLLTNYENVWLAELNSLNNTTIDEHALVPDEPVRPRTAVNTILAAIVGGMLSLGVVFLIEYLDDRVKDPVDIERSAGLGTIGMIGRLQIANGIGPLVMKEAPRSPEAEAFRQLRTNIQFAGVSHQIQSVLVTSVEAGDGKSTTSANLAAALAQAGYQVILVDADLRRPVQHKLFNLHNSQGLTMMLINDARDPAFLQKTDIPNLRVLPSGPLPPNPAELVGSQRLKELLNWLEEQADFVLVDSPPILAVTDSSLLAQVVDTTLLVLKSDKTRLPAMEIACRRLRDVEGHIAGAVLNQVDFKHSDQYQYYATKYTYEEEPHEPQAAPSKPKKRTVATTLPIKEGLTKGG